MEDKETKQILSEADHIKNMIGSDGWKLVKAKLDMRILDLQNINNLDMTDVSTLAPQLAARKMAVEILFAWLKGDIYGFVEQQEKNNQKLTNEKTEQFINRE